MTQGKRRWCHSRSACPGRSALTPTTVFCMRSIGVCKTVAICQTVTSMRRMVLWRRPLEGTSCVDCLQRRNTHSPACSSWTSSWSSRRLIRSSRRQVIAIVSIATVTAMTQTHPEVGSGSTGTFDVSRNVKFRNNSVITVPVADVHPCRCPCCHHC